MNDAFDPLHALQAAGFELEAMNDEQREVLGTLTPEELGLLADVRLRIMEAGPEVQAHVQDPFTIGGLLF